MKTKAIVFDWNGTLLADSIFCWRATNTVLKAFGRPPVSLAQYRQHTDVPIDKVYKSLGCDMKEILKRLDEVYRVWDGVYNAQANKARLRRGARKVLQILRKNERHTVILSNHSIDNIAGHVNRLGIRKHFAAILANDDRQAVFRTRAKGARLQKYMKENALTGAIIVGDTEEEVEIARAHNFVSVAITDGICSTKRLRAAKPDFLIDSLDEIPSIASRVFGNARKARA
jgi:phosphoglycolate phosphatase-like HAD superfamily hydrolase